MLDTLGKDESQAAIVEETYRELEAELLQRIAGLEKQVQDNIELRNQLISVGRKMKTVADVFDDILSKPKLDKRDVALIVERNVYNDHLDIRLKADIDELLSTGNDASQLPESVTQRIVKHPEKVFSVNVVNEDDRLWMRRVCPHLQRRRFWRAAAKQHTFRF